MNVSLNKKMLAMGVLIVAAFGVLLGLMKYKDIKVSSARHASRSANETAVMRKDQLVAASRFEFNLVRLSLAAMDSIVEKESGVVDKELKAEINARADYLKKNVGMLDRIADTDLEKQKAAQVRESLATFTKNIQVDLETMIKASARQQQEIEAAFAHIDDVLGKTGGAVGDGLARLEASFEGRLMSLGSGTPAYWQLKQGIDRVNAMRLAHARLMLAAMNALSERDAGKIDKAQMAIIDETIAFQQHAIEAATGHAKTDEEKALADDIKTVLPDLINGTQVELKGLIENAAMKQQQIAAAFGKMEAGIDAQAESIEAALSEFRGAIEQEVRGAFAKASAVERRLAQDTQRLEMVIWGFSMAVVLAIAVNFYFFTRSITRPINRMVADLSHGVGQIQSASGHVSSSSQAMAEGASEQTAAIEETSSSLEQMASMTRQNAESAGQADKLMEESVKVVEWANESMQELTRSMDAITAASQETSKIIKSIDEIAFQTNLLALNAAVEAARAGEAGAGFAVVADEVRNLALRATEAARNTAELIEGTVKRIGQGSELVSTTNEAFAGMLKGARKVADIVGDIAAASGEQSQGIDQINVAVADMDKVVQQTAANAEESASTAEEMTAQVAVTNNVIRQLIALTQGGRREDAAAGPPAVSGGDPARVSATHATRAVAGPKGGEVKPGDVIPLGTDDFKDF